MLRNGHRAAEGVQHSDFDGFGLGGGEGGGGSDEECETGEFAFGFHIVLTK